MKVSVALCTYNGESYLQEQLDSILNQSRSVDEILVCDDISTDTTFAILEGYAKKYPNLFKLVKNETNLRSVKNFEKAIGLCTGDIIFLSDQDDSWLPEKVYEVIRFFDENENIDAVFTNAFFMNETSQILKDDLWNSNFFQPQKKEIFDLFKYLIFKKNCVTGATLCIKKNVKDYIFPFPEVANLHHDYWIAILVAYRAKLGYLNKKLIRYRIHSEQQVGATLHRSKLKKIKNIFIDRFLFDNKKNIIYMKKIRIKLMSNLNLFLKLQQIYPKKIEFSDAINLIKEKIKK